MANSAYQGFLELDIPATSYEEARIHIIPVELEKSVSYGGGTASGPRAILEASQQLEAYDCKTIPGQAGMFTHKPIKCQAGTVNEDLAVIASEVTRVIEKNSLPVILGGEHTVTLGALKAFKACGKKLGVVQFDAHADLRDSYGGNPLSHACIMRRVHEMGLPFVQLGIRSMSLEEDTFRKEHNIQSLDAAAIYTAGIPAQILPRNFPEQIYITFDVDCFDVAIMPATGTPEPGGLTWYQVMDLLHKVAAGRTICGFDVVELAPIDCMHAPNYTAAKLVYKLMGLAVSSDNQW